MSHLIPSLLAASSGGSEDQVITHQGMHSGLVPQMMDLSQWSFCVDLKKKTLERCSVQRVEAVAREHFKRP